jgi:phospholipid transport system transporter-binding protein
MRSAVPAKLRVEGTVAYFEGDLTLDAATRLLAEGRQALQQGVSQFDLAGVGEMDSSALSVILGLRRVAEATERTFQLQSVSASLLSLAKLYGVADHL